MKPHGSYKLRYRHAARSEPPPPPLTRRAAAAETLLGVDGFLARLARSEHRVRRILASLRDEILEAGASRHLRIRRVFQSPQEIYRLELELPDLGYQRTTFLDRDALEELLEADDVREVVETAALSG
jgi:hypothetical protein